MMFLDLINMLTLYGIKPQISIAILFRAQLKNIQIYLLKNTS